MFQKTRMRLTVLNAVVFFLILSVFSAVVYLTVRHHLFGKVDAMFSQEVTLNKTAMFRSDSVTIRQAAQAGVSKAAVKATMADDQSKTAIKATTTDDQSKTAIKPLMIATQLPLDSRMVTMFWSSKGELLDNLLAAKQRIEINEADFRNLPVDGKIRTVKSLGHTYRVLTRKEEAVVLAAPAAVAASTEAAPTGGVSVGSGSTASPSGGVTFGSASAFSPTGSETFGSTSAFSPSGGASVGSISVSTVAGGATIGSGSVSTVAGGATIGSGSVSTMAGGAAIGSGSAAQTAGGALIGSSGETPPLNASYFVNKVVNVYAGNDWAAKDIAVTQSVVIIDAETGMLRSLLIVMLVAVFLGGGVAFIAGSYLAHRALVPIRTSWERQQQFVSDASHELRTPLAVIRANTELLLRHPDETIEQQSSTISAVLKETKRLSKLVASLLTLARSDSNQLELARKPLDLASVLGEAARKFVPLAEFKGVDMSVEVESGITTVGDEERLQQLCVIFLDNALKFTDPGGVIRFVCKRSTGAATIIVEDTGTGIARHDLPYIFDRFYQGNRVRTRADNGSGLGLSIAKWIVEKHGGTIKTTSERGQGTQFAITLPLLSA